MRRHTNFRRLSKRGDILAEPIIKWAMILLSLVVFWMVAGQPLYGLVKDALGIVPDECGLERKSVRDYQEQLTALLHDEKITEMERIYAEFVQCNLRHPLDDETHFKLGKAGYDFHLKRFEYRRAPYILRDYVNRDPAGAHWQEALTLIEAAERLFKESPTARIAAAADLERRDWQAAKRAYKDIIDDITGKGEDYRKAFSKENINAHTRYIHLEADQFSGKDLQFQPSHAAADPARGSVTYTLSFDGIIAPYTLTISPEQRTLTDPTAPLIVRLKRGSTDVPLRKDAGNLLDYEANSFTANELLERLQTIACADRGTAPTGSSNPLIDPTTRLPCARTTILLGLTGTKTLELPVPSAAPLQTDRVSFTKTPALPLSLDPFLLSSYPTIDVTYRGKPYTMSLLVEKYPSTTISVAWSDRTRALGNTPEAHDLTFQSILSLCPDSRDIDPHADKAEEQLIRCLWKRQIFTPTYQPRYPAQGSTPERLAAPPANAPIERPPYSW